MPTIQVETEQLLHAALQIPRAELEQFVTRLLALKLAKIRHIYRRRNRNYCSTSIRASRPPRNSVWTP
jgi:hypothetical protein